LFLIDNNQEFEEETLLESAPTIPCKTSPRKRSSRDNAKQSPKKSPKKDEESSPLMISPVSSPYGSDVCEDISWKIECGIFLDDLQSV
jgi:hypothetical protein